MGPVSAPVPCPVILASLVIVLTAPASCRASGSCASVSLTTPPTGLFVTPPTVLVITPSGSVFTSSGLNSVAATGLVTTALTVHYSSGLVTIPEEMDVKLPNYEVPLLEIMSLGCTSTFLSAPVRISLQIYASIYSSILYKHLLSEVEINIKDGKK